eukprot:superscaffoldBa00008397_g23312
MSVTALFRGKWGPKSQETPEKHAAAVVQQNHEVDDDEDDSKVGFSREPIRRNSRFYRSMRKKRLVSSEHSDRTGLEDEVLPTDEEHYSDSERELSAQLGDLNNPSDWPEHLDAKTVDLLVGKGPVKVSNFDFPMNQEKRHLSDDY